MGNTKKIYAAEPTSAGSIYAAPVGTPGPSLPTPFAALNVAFTSLGDVGEDGFNEVTDKKIDKKRNFGGKVVKVLQSEFGKTVELVFIESLNADVLKAIYGANNVTIVAATSTSGEIIQVNKNAKRLPHLSWVIDTVDSSLGKDASHVAKYRSYIGDGQITDTKDVKIVHTDTIEYGVTIECYEDANGNHMQTWSDDGVPTGS